MEQKTNTTTKHEAVATPKNGYKVTPETAALLDCLRATTDLYAQISAALDSIYKPLCVGDAEQAAAPYLQLTTGIANLLHEEVTRRLIDKLGDVENSHNTEVITL